MEGSPSESEVMHLFGRTQEDTRWQGVADSQEFLSLIFYLVRRNTSEGEHG